MDLHLLLTSLFFYKSRGCTECKLDYINDILLLSQNIIFCIQEHFLLRNNIYKLSNAVNNFSVLAKPAYKNFNIQNQGRPMGGLCIVIPKVWRKYVTIVNTCSWRIQAILIKLNNITFLIVNSYFPTDPKTLNADNYELEAVLSEISGLINTNTFDQCYIVGDLNANFL